MMTQYANLFLTRILTLTLFPNPSPIANPNPNPNSVPGRERLGEEVERRRTKRQRQGVQRERRSRENRRELDGGKEGEKNNEHADLHLRVETLNCKRAPKSWRIQQHYITYDKYSQSSFSPQILQLGGFFPPSRLPDTTGSHPSGGWAPLMIPMKKCHDTQWSWDRNIERHSTLNGRVNVSIRAVAHRG
eukprot:1336486-Amorphochlora_amoeboformis.AAC.1